MTNSKAIYASTSTKNSNTLTRTVPDTSSDHLLIFLGWLGLFGAPLFLDWVLNRRKSGLTFSESTRDVLDDLPHGRTAFAVAWPGFAGWFWWHIVLQHRK